MIELKEAINVSPLRHSRNHQSKPKNHANTKKSDFSNEGLGLFAEKQKNCGNCRDDEVVERIDF
jgi:hypothetical protein